VYVCRLYCNGSRNAAWCKAHHEATRQQRSPFFIVVRSEKSRCLDAFAVAVSQACAGDKKRWYTSTLELQLASLGFCRVCRGVPALSVVAEDNNTP